MTSPTPEEIRAARLTAGLTVRQACEMVHASPRSWQNYEAGDRVMHPAIWELFRIKVAQRG